MVVNNVKQATSTTAYANAVKGLSLEQAKLALSTKQLSAIEKEQILIKAGLLNATGKLTTGQLTEILTNKQRNAEDAKALLLSTGLISAETAEATATNIVETAKLEELVATKQLTVAEAELIAMKAKVSTANIKEASTSVATAGKMSGSISILGSSVGSALTKIGSGLLSFASAHPVITALTAIVGLVGITNSQLKKYEQEQKELIENAKTLQDEYRSFVQSSSDNINSLKAQADEFEELSKGVTQYGENISLSADEYDRYKSIVAEVLGYTPELVDGYNAEGTAIANKNSLIERSIELMKEEQRQKLKEMTTDEKTGVAYKGAKAEWDDVNAGYEGAYTRNDIGNILRDNEKSSGFWVESDIIKALDLEKEWEDYKKTHTSSSERNLDNFTIDNIEAVAKAIKENKQALTDLTDTKGKKVFSEKEINSLIDKANTWQEQYAEWQQEIEDSKHGMDDQFSLYAQRADGYDDLTDAQRAFVSEYIKATGDIIDADGKILSEDEMIEKAESYEKFVDKLATSPEFADARKKINELFALDSSTISAGEYEKQVNDILEELQTKFELTDDEVKDFKIALGFDFIEDGSSTRVSELVEKVQGKIKDDFDDNVLDLSLDDLVIASNLEIPDDVELSWEDFIKLLNEAKEIPNKITVLSITDSIKQIADQLEPQFAKLGEAYRDIFTEDGFTLDNIDNSMLEDLRDTFTDIEEELGVTFDTTQLNNFFDVLTNGSSEPEDVQKAFNDLATSYLNSTDVLESLNEETAESVIKQLEQMGVTNAETIVMDRLNAKKEAEDLITNKLNITKDEFIKLSADEQQALLDEADASEICRTYLAQLTLAENNFNKNNLDVTGKIESLKALAVAYGLVNTEAKALEMQERQKKMEEYEKRTGANTGFKYTEVDYKHLEDSARKEIEAKFENLGKVNYDGNKTSYASKDKSSSSKDKDPEDFDWIETKLNNTSDSLDKVKDKVNDTYSTWENRNKSLQKAIADTQNAINLQAQAEATYLAKANSIALPEYLKSRVRLGDMSIQDNVDENTSKLINEYKEWYDKAKACKDAQDELNNSLNELKSTQFFELINSEYDALYTKLDNSLDVLQSKIDKAEMQGLFANESYYTSMIGHTQAKINNLEKERKQLQDVLNSSGVKNDTEAWNEMYQTLMDTDSEIRDLENQIIEFNNNIRDLDWEIFEYLEESINRITDETEYLTDLLSNEDLYDENGNLTKYANATIGLYATAYDTYKQQAKDYYEEVQDLQRQLVNGAGKDVLEQYYKMVDAHQEAVKSANQEKQAILDLISDGYQAQLDAIQKLIDKKKEQMQQEKNLFDYQKNIADKTKNISSLQKQYDIYKNDMSEEGIAQAQKIKVSLDEAKADLRETEYEQYLQDSQDMLDQLSEDYEEWMNNRLDNEDALLSEIIGTVSGKGDEINSTLNEVADKYGTMISDSITSIFDAKSPFTNTLSNGITTINNSIAGTTSAIDRLIAQVANITNANASKTNAGNGTKGNNSKPSGNSNNGNNTNTSGNIGNNNSNNSTPQNSSNNSVWGSWFIRKTDSYPKNKLDIQNSIVDRLKYNSIDSSFSARSKYYSAMGGSGTYTGSASQNTWMLNQLKSHGYAKGSKRIPYDQIALLGEEGNELQFDISEGVLREVGEGDKIFTNEASKVLWDFSKNPSEFIEKFGLANLTPQFNFVTPTLPPIARNNASNSVNMNVDGIEINLPNVTNYKEFRNELIKDSDFTNAMGTYVNNKIMGKNPLEHLKYVK